MKQFLSGIFVLSILFINPSFSQQTLYSETFANGSLQNTWYAGFSGNNMEVEFLTGNPSGDGWVGKLGNDISGGGVGESYSGEISWTDFYMEAQVFIPVSVGVYYGIEFRVDSVGNTSGYQLVARNSATGSSLRFRARAGATPTTIREWTSAEIPGGYPTTDGWHKMAVRAIGSQFWLYFDDQELPGNPYTDNTYASGWIGTYVWDMTVSPIYLYIDDITVTEPTTGIEEDPVMAVTDYQLEQNYPNPFNPSTMISFTIPRSGLVNMSVYNSLGQKIRSLVNRDYSAGNHQVEWDGRDDYSQLVPAGIYYYKLHSGEFTATRRMLMVK